MVFLYSIGDKWEILKASISTGPLSQPALDQLIPPMLFVQEMAGGNAIAQSSSQPTLADATLALYQQTAQAIQQQQKQQQLQLAQQQQQPKVQPQQAVPQPVLTMRDAIIFAITYSTDLRSTIKMPYFLTLTPAELDALAGQGDPSGAGAAHFRGRTRNITSGGLNCFTPMEATLYRNFCVPEQSEANCIRTQGQLLGLLHWMRSTRGPEW